jgi:inosose dehydratase
MSTQITITTAPCCWGVDDVNNPHLPRWEKVLDEAKAAGFGGLELGPYGYLPLDLELVSEALNKRGLKIVAGTIFDDLVNPGNRESLLRQTDEICALITKLPKPETHPGQRFEAPYLTVMDWGHDERDYAAGHSDRAPRLDAEAWAGIIGNVRAIAELARDKYGVRATIHPHAGGYIEFADELARVVEDISADIAGLCLDTGHMDYSGMDPVATLRRYWIVSTTSTSRTSTTRFTAKSCASASDSLMPATRASCAQLDTAGSTTRPCAPCSLSLAMAATSPSNRNAIRVTPPASSKMWRPAGLSWPAPVSDARRFE